MLESDIPGFGLMKLEHLVCDYTGTLSIDGKIIPGVKERLNALARILSVHVVTSDTFGTAQAELTGINCTVLVVSGKDIDIQKETYVTNLGREKVVAIGNGNNDRKMLKISRFGIAVIEEEGGATDAITSADIAVKNVLNAFDLLLQPKRAAATLRF